MLHALISIVYAILGGVLPALIWLFFWTREDRENPEPIGMVALAFIGGIIAVFISLFIEKIIFGINIYSLFPSETVGQIMNWFQEIAIKKNILLDNFLMVIIFAPIIEEVSKFVIDYIFVLRSKEDDEPIDPIIYMIATALGFAAIENVLFLIDPILENNLTYSIVTGNMRFIGASLIHTIASATIGIILSLNFFKRRFRRDMAVLFAIFMAILIHAIFNFFLIGSTRGSIITLEIIWASVIMILLIFEKIKKIRVEKI